MLQIRCGRLGTSGSDTLAGTARLFYVTLVYDTTSQ